MRRRAPALRPLVEVLEARDGSLYLLRGPAQGDMVIREPSDDVRAVIAAMARGQSPPESVGRDVIEEVVAALAAEDLLEPPAANTLSAADSARFDRQLLYLRQHATAEVPADELQRRIRGTRIVVIGCGGLGSWAAWSVACLGVGSLVLVDFDVVDIANLNRQLLFTTADIGRLKCEAARDRLVAFDPALDVEPVATSIEGPDHVAELVEGADVVLACADSPPYDIARWIDDGCWAAGVPHVSAGQLPPFVRVGPFVVPGITPSLRCFERQLRAETPLYDELEAMRKAEARPAATLGPACGLVGSILALDVAGWITKLHEPATWRRALSIDMRSMRTTSTPIAAMSAAMPPCRDAAGDWQ